MIDFMIGKARVRPVIELDYIENPGFFIPDLTREEVLPFLDQLGPDHLDPETLHPHISHHTWLIEVGGKRILVDPCVGHQREYPLLPFFHMLDSRFLERLAEMGAPADTIDYVFCTHMHFDHVGWNTRTVDGRIVPTFPNARYLFGRTENEYWKHDLGPGEPRSPYNVGAYSECVQPVVEAGLAEMVDAGHRIAGCMTLIDTPGHTIGHMAGVLESADEGGVFCGDAIHHPTQVVFSDRMSHGHDAAQLIASRRMLLELCAERDFWLVPAHFRTPHVCKIRRSGTGYRMEWATEQSIRSREGHGHEQ